MHLSSSLIPWLTWVRTFKAILLHTQVKSLVLNQMFVIFKIRVCKIETLISQHGLHFINKNYTKNWDAY